MAGFNLIIDGNYVLYKGIHTLNKSGLIYSNLHDLITSSIDAAIKWYKFDNVYFVSDKGTSWRKKIYPEYKSLRVKSEEIDWDFCMTTYSEVKDIYNNKRDDVSLIESNNVEGDDIIYYLVKNSNRNGISTIILSDDGDMKQLIESSFESKNKYYINLMVNEKYNNNFMYIPNSLPAYKGKLLLESKEIDLFDESADDIYEEYKFINNMMNTRTTKTVDNIDCLLIKILMGDKGDNIKSVYSKVGSTGKTSGLGEATAEKIVAKYREEINPNIDMSNIKKTFETITELVCEKYKIPLSDEETYNSIKNKIEFNNKLVNLNEIPKNIIDKIENVYNHEQRQFG